MKREEILFYMREDRIYILSFNSNSEHVIDRDTSSFFKCGEISDAKKARAMITEIMSKLIFGPVYIKPNINILYNDICYGDIKFLYKYILSEQEYNKISFFPLTTIVKEINDSDNIVVFDKNYYTLIGKGIKTMDENIIDIEPIYIGKNDKKHIHYSEDNIIWKTFKTYFTNIKNYDKID